MNSSTTTSLQVPGQQPISRNYFHSRRVKKGEVEKPWLAKVDPKEKWVTILPCIGLAIGVGLAGYLIYDGLSSVTHHVYCPILYDNFSTGFNTDVWIKEAEVGGYRYDEFEQTTSDEENVFVDNGMLYIKPTLQSADLVEQDSIINLFTDNICTSTAYSACVAETNVTNGTIVPPVKSGRINTSKSKSIKYGRVEVEAKMPAGDWLWPAIWMSPLDNVYGNFPASGEIDLITTRGNNWTYYKGGNDIMSSTLHWGPTEDEDGWYLTNVKRQALHSSFADKFHTFGLEWSEKYIYTYLDSRLLQVLYTKTTSSFWTRGDFASGTDNDTYYADPWTDGGINAPFDQEFYLVINVAVGGTNGWFGDGYDGKPWVDASTEAKLQFWEARDQWYPTWEQNGQMVVKSVKMWQQAGYLGCDV